MIKKLLLSLIIIPFLGITVAVGQCTPDPNLTHPGVFPDSATGLPHGTVNVLYAATLTLIIPTDTTIGGFTVPIDSIGIVGFQGLPAGFSYVPSSSTGFWAGGATGCVLITGTSSVPDTASLVISVMGSASGMEVPFTIDYYKIIIEAPESIQENANYGLEIYQNSPNPFSNVTEISFSSDVNSAYNVEVFNVIGKVIYTEVVKAQKGVNKLNFDATELPQGVYFYKISNGNRTATKRMIVTTK